MTFHCRLCSTALTVDARPVRGCEGYVVCPECGAWTKAIFPPAPAPPPVVDENFDGDDEARRQRSLHAAGLFGGL